MKSCRTIFVTAFPFAILVACGRGDAPASTTLVDIASANVSNAAPHI